MHINCIHAAAMAYHHIISCRRAVSRDHDLTRSSSHDRCSRRRADIDSLMVRGRALRRGFSPSKAGSNPPAGRTRPCKANVPKTHGFIRLCRLVCRCGLFLFFLGFLSRFLFLPLDLCLDGLDLDLLGLDGLRVLGDLSLRGGDLRLVVLKLRLFCSQKLLHGRLFCLRLVLKHQELGMFTL